MTVRILIGPAALAALAEARHAAADAPTKRKKIGYDDPGAPDATPVPVDESDKFCAACAADADCPVLNDGTTMVCASRRCALAGNVCNNIWWSCALDRDLTCDDFGRARCRLKSAGTHPKKHGKRRYTKAHDICANWPPMRFDHRPAD